MQINLFILALYIGATSAFLSTDSSMLNLDSKCGKGTALRRKRIIGGSASLPTHHGWHVLIKNSNGQNLCGGSLIDDYWVVTAASCVSSNLQPSAYTLEFGIVDRNAPWQISKNFRRKGKKIFVHPSYDRVAIRNDIALIKLDVEVSSLSSYQVEKVCVPTGTEYYQDRYGYATGFGSYDIYGKTDSATKQQVNLPILSDARCKAKFGTLVDTYTQVCAGDNGLNKDTCVRDTGGPLVAKNSKGRWHLVGIASWGRNPCGNGGVYTRVSAFSSYIKDIIKKN